MTEIMLVLDVVILVMQVLITLLIFRWEGSRTSTYECDALWLDIAKTLLSEPRLWDFYGLGPEEERKGWQRMSDDDKRMYIFCEMNYYHLAFVYREYLQKRVSKAYWNIHKPWLRKLIQYSPMFREVHQGCRMDYEPEFVRLVDELEEQVSHNVA